MPQAYVELHCLSNFTFLRGASRAEELVERAAQLGYSALAITDECSLAGVVRAHVAAKEHNLQFIIGTEITLTPHPAPLHRWRGRESQDSNGEKTPRPPGTGRGNLRLVLLAQNREGYGNLSELITCGRRNAEKGEYRLSRADLGSGLEHCLALWLPPAQPQPEDAHWLAQRFPGRTWIAVELLARGGDWDRLETLQRLGRQTGLPLTACGDVHMHVRSRRALQDTLSAIRLSVPVAQVGRALLPSGERHLRRRETLERIYPRELLAETLRIAARCDFSLDSLRYEYPQEIVPAGETPAQYLRQLVEAGLRWRFPPPAEGLRTEDSGLSESRQTQRRYPTCVARRSTLLGAEDAKSAEKNGSGCENQLLITTVPPFSQHSARSIPFNTLLSIPARRVPLRGTQHPPFTQSSVLSPESWFSRSTQHPAPSTCFSPLTPHASCETVPDKVRQLIEHELSLIAELGYEPYFLTVHDIVKYARSQGILCQGRGSAANSAVCYALGITEVDPGRMQMLFERFISRERNEPPDIDVDFEHQRREEVIQYLYAKYGRERAAIAATVITYRSRSAFRDVGKALGLDLAQVDRISKSFAWWDRRDERAARLQEAGFDPGSPVIRKLVWLTDALIGFPRHLSQHVGGFVISRGPLSRLVPIENAAMPERTNIQWDKDDLDVLGLLKVDVLALGMLSAIRRALDLVSRIRAKPFGMADVPPEDPQVYAMLQQADSIGVFQIESRAQMSMLPRLRPANYYDLVIEVAIVRPGPIQGGMVHPYLRRRQGLEPVTYPSEAVRSVLERTLGVPIFQEQVMQLAVVAAGFTPGEADHLRRSMAAWRRKGGLHQFEEKLISGMRERGYSEEFARQIFQQILGFGEYGFPESHSASFALLVYVSAWLKCHEHAAFTCALLNSQPMGFYAPSQLVQDAQRHGIEVRPVDVLQSEWDCTLEPHSGSGTRCEVRGTSEERVLRAACCVLRDCASQSLSLGPQPSVLGPESQHAIRLGLRMVGGLSEAAAQRLIAARSTQHSAPILPDLEELALRAKLNRRDLRCLAEAGALASLAGHRRNAAWLVAGIEERPPVLASAAIVESAVDLPAPTEGQDIVADYASLGLTLRRHPLALLRPQLARLRMITAQELLHTPTGKPVRVAGLVTCRQRPGTASGVIFITLEDETGQINVVVWRGVSEKQRRPLLAASLLGVHGVLEREGAVTHLIAGKLVDYSALLGNLVTHSRDFH
jgi:error-prone DNA polymerase